MKKLAIFVEGQTEQLFVEKLITEIGGVHQVRISTQSRTGSQILELTGEDEGDGSKYFVLIFDCQNDEQVMSTIRERIVSLQQAGYSAVLGLRDLYPFQLNELQDLRDGLAAAAPASTLPVRIHVAVAEVEAWFLQESTHYPRVHTRLDPRNFKSQFGFDPLVDSAEQFSHPSDLLQNIYNSVGLGYLKTRRHVQRTVGAIDYANLCFTCRPLLPAFADFYDDVDAFLA